MVFLFFLGGGDIPTCFQRSNGMTSEILRLMSEENKRLDDLTTKVEHCRVALGYNYEQIVQHLIKSGLASDEIEADELLREVDE